MKIKKKAKAKSVPFDPILFAATVPVRKPTPEDIAACRDPRNTVKVSILAAAKKKL